MKKIRTALAGGLLAVAAATAQAAVVIPDTDIEYVDSQGRAWLDVNIIKASWLSLSQVCDVVTGECQGEIQGVLRPTIYSLDGWYWASRDEVAQVFTEVAGSLTTPDLNALFAVFECTLGYCYTPPIDEGYRYLHGISRTLIDATTVASPFAAQNFVGGVPVNGRIELDFRTPSNSADYFFGSYMYRRVPEPATAALVLAAGGLLLAQDRRRRQPRQARSAHG